MKGFSKYLSVLVFGALAMFALGFLSSSKAIGPAPTTICDSVNDPSSHLCDVYCNKLDCGAGGGQACDHVLDAFLNLTEDARFDFCPRENGTIPCSGKIAVCRGGGCDSGERCVIDVCTDVERCIPNSDFY